MGIPAIAFTLAGIWLLAGFLIAYNYTGQIAVPQGVKGVIGLASLIFGMAFMVSYNVVYSVKNASEGKKE
jgi:cellobiose-specific phosphotransferase system component IIC